MTRMVQASGNQLNLVSPSAGPDLLRLIPMLAGLDDDAREALAAASSVVQVERGAMIAVEGAPEPAVFFVLEGLVVGCHMALDGRSQTLARLHQGAPFFIPSAFAKDSRAPVCARALQRSKLLVTPQPVFRDLAHQHPSLALAALKEISNKVTHFVRLAGDQGVLSVRARLARLLLELADGCDPPTVSGTHEDLAAGVGSVREVVSRHLNEMGQEGLVKVSRGRVELSNPAGLRKESGRF